MFAGIFPRLADVFLWIARPVLFTAPFNGNWIWPLLGIIFLPFSTLLYVLLWTPGIGLSGWDWIWVALAAVMDVTNWVGHYRARTEYPGYSPSMTA
jgi:hypothetical protein